MKTLEGVYIPDPPRSMRVWLWLGITAIYFVVIGEAIAACWIYAAFMEK